MITETVRTELADQSISLLLVGFYNINIYKLVFTYFIFPSFVVLSHYILNYSVKCFMFEKL